MHQRRVLLGDLIHLGDGLIDLLDARALLLGGCRYFIHDVGDPAYRPDDFPHGGTGFFYQLRAFIDLRRGSIDQSLDLLGRLGTAAGQVAYFAGDDRETAPLLACPGSLDRGIERQNIGLEGNRVDHVDDIGHLLGARRNPVHGRDDLLDHVAALYRLTRSIVGQGAGLMCVIGVLLHGLGQLLHAGSGFLQGSRLLLGARR